MWTREEDYAWRAREAVRETPPAPRGRVRAHDGKLALLTLLITPPRSPPPAPRAPRPSPPALDYVYHRAERRTTIKTQMQTTTKTDVTVNVKANAINEKPYGLDKEAVMKAAYPDSKEVDFTKMCKLTAVRAFTTSRARASPARPTRLAGCISARFGLHSLLYFLALQ